MNNIEVSLKFRSLFNLFDDNHHPEIDTVIITGGRYSLKSYTVSIFALIALVNYGWNVLYTRYTNMSIVDSVKPEVTDKIELMGLDGKVQDTNTHVEYNGNRISFKGIKTGSLAQTANLKSLSGFNLFINDEAEELPDYKTFKKIFYSMRSMVKRNLTILILNPTTKEHWIFQEFFKKKGLNGGENCIKDNVLYIHSSYLDADAKQIPKNILADYNRLKTEEPKEYDNIVLGGWITELEGQIFPDSSLKKYKEFPENMEYFTIGYIDSADTGEDYFAMIIARVYGNRVYIIDAIFDQYNLTIQEAQVQNKVKIDGINELVIETNSFGAYFSRRIRELIPHIEVFGMFSKTNKMGRIIANSGLIKHHFYFPENPNETLKKFMTQVTALLATSTDKDDACLVAGTRISTLFGFKNIEDIKIGDIIITPFGLRKVINSGCTGIKPVIKNIGLTGTKNHKVFTTTHFKCLKDTRENEVSKLSFYNLLLWKYKKLLCSMEQNTDLWGRENIILVNQRNLQCEKVPKDFIGQYGNFIMKKQYPKVFVFTIKTVILLITTSIIWSAYRSVNISVIMQKRICKILSMLKEIMKYLILLGKRPMNGIEVKKVENGTPKMVKSVSDWLRKSSVLNAGMNLIQFNQMQNSVQAYAVNNTIGYITVSNIPQSANIAEKNLQAKSLKEASQTIDSAPRNAHMTTSNIQKVYNITVEKDGCYYANNILVSNCDSMSGLCAYLEKYKSLFINENNE